MDKKMHGIQIMDVYEFNCANNFHGMKELCSIQKGKAEFFTSG